MGVSWATYSGWVLRYRRSLLAKHRVVAAKMGLLFAVVFTAGAAGLALTGGQPAMQWAAALGSLMATAAIGLWVRAHRHRARRKP